MPEKQHQIIAVAAKDVIGITKEMVDNPQSPKNAKEMMMDRSDALIGKMIEAMPHDKGSRRYGT